MIERYKQETSQDGFAPLGFLQNGGKGSGFFGHFGRKGKRGGSQSSFSDSSILIKGNGATVTEIATKYLNKEEWASIKSALESELAKQTDIDLSEVTITVRNLEHDAKASANSKELALSPNFPDYIEKPIGSWESDILNKKRSYATDGTYAGIIRHELGHMYSKQVQRNRNIPQDALLYYSYAKTTGLNGKGSSIYESQRKSKNIKISKRGLSNIQETFAEAYANPNYSNFTQKFVSNFKQAIYDYENGKLTKEKILDHINR